MFRTFRAAAALALALFASGAFAQNAADTASRAADAFVAKEWATAEKLYGELLDDAAQKGLAAYRRAVAQLYLGRVAEARAGLDRAEKEGFQPVAAEAGILYTLRCASTEPISYTG